MERRGGHLAWLPAHVAWLPALLAGFWLLFMRARTTQSGPDEWVVQVAFVSPDAWFVPLWRGILGVAILTVGLVAWGASRWEPQPWRALAVSRYTAFSVGAMLLMFMGLLAWWYVDLTTSVISPGGGGLRWRFIAAQRTHVLDRIVQWSALVGATLLYTLSFGPSRSTRGTGSLPAD